VASFVLGVAVALSIAVGGRLMRQGAGERTLPAPQPARASTEPASPPHAGTAGGGEPRASIYVMNADDPAERALADARRAHEEARGRANAERIVRRDAEAGEPARGPSPAATAEPPAVAAEAGPVATAEPRAPAESEATVARAEARSRDTTRRGERTDGVPDLDGWWMVTNSIDSTDYSPFAGLQLTYRVHLQRQGDRIVGRGTKWAEDGRRIGAASRTPIFVSGVIRDAHVELRFVEHGLERVSEGRFQWQISPGAAHLDGRFSSDVANSSGRSEARRAL